MREGDEGADMSILQMYLLGGKSGHHIDECLSFRLDDFSGSIEAFPLRLH